MKIDGWINLRKKVTLCIFEIKYINKLLYLIIY